MAHRLLLACLPLLLLACGTYEVPGAQDVPSQAESIVGSYRATILVDQSADADLVDPWGIAFNPDGPVWTANRESRTSTLYDGTGAKTPLTVSIPDGNPTGIVFSGGTAFNSAPLPLPASFIFAGEGGTIAAWSIANLTNAATVYDDGGGALYTGLAIVQDRLYAADFANAKVDVLDSAYAKLPAGGFTDPELPPGCAPYGISAAGSAVVVTYAGSCARAALFDPAGALLRRLDAPDGTLDEPWGIALAPADFGAASGLLLIGNAGDGAIHAFDPATGAWRGALGDAQGQALRIEGLRGLAFGTGSADQPANVLFFAAGGPGRGAYGRIEQVTAGGVSLAQIQSQTFTPRCVSCHDGNGSALPGSLDLSSTERSYAELVNVPSEQVPSLMLVAPGNADDSYLVHKVEGTQQQGSRMPRGGLPLSADEVADIRAWIDAGAAP